MDEFRTTRQQKADAIAAADQAGAEIDYFLEQRARQADGGLVYKDYDPSLGHPPQATMSDADSAVWNHWARRAAWTWRASGAVAWLQSATWG